MSGRIYLELKVDEKPVVAESSVTSIGGVDVSKMIECDSYTEGCKTAQEAGSRTPTGTRLYQPIIIRKSIDSSSPLLSKALTETEYCSGRFLFFRPAKGTAKQELFFVVEMTEARVSEIKRFLPEDTTGGSGADVSGSGKPPQELISFVFGTCRWTHEIGKTEHHDIWQKQ